MEGFSDSDKFRFRTVRSTDPTCRETREYLTPVHHRFLGNKNGYIYEMPTVRWSDVVINDVPLEKTFEYEDDIVSIEAERSISSEEQGTIMINSRPSQSPTVVEEIEDKRWVKRLEKLYPMNYQEAKKKRKSIERYPVKPKSMVRDEKIYTSSDKFQEITDEKCGGEIILDYTIYTHKHVDLMMDRDFTTPVYNIYQQRIYTKYCPPLHWLEPEVQWEKIFIHLNELQTGKKDRDYHYYPDKNLLEFPEKNISCGKEPCIFFYDKDSEDLNYNFNWSTDYMDVYNYFNSY